MLVASGELIAWLSLESNEPKEWPQYRAPESCTPEETAMSLKSGACLDRRPLSQQRGISAEYKCCVTFFSGGQLKFSDISKATNHRTGKDLRQQTVPNPRVRKSLILHLFGPPAYEMPWQGLSERQRGENRWAPAGFLTGVAVSPGDQGEPRQKRERSLC